MFFSKKIQKAELSFLVYFTKIVKYQQLITRLKSENNSQTLLYYFEQTKSELEDIFNAADLKGHRVIHAQDYVPEGSNTPILVEVHPLASVTDKLVNKLNPETTIECYMGMDELLMKLFGSEHITSIMRKLGMEPNEVISHNMVTQSIFKAQSKLDQKLPNPKDVRESMEKWATENGVDQMAL